MNDMSYNVNLYSIYILLVLMKEPRFECKIRKKQDNAHRIKILYQNQTRTPASTFNPLVDSPWLRK